MVKYIYVFFLPSFPFVLVIRSPVFLINSPLLFFSHEFSPPLHPFIAEHVFFCPFFTVVLIPLFKRSLHPSTLHLSFTRFPSKQTIGGPSSIACHPRNPAVFHSLAWSQRAFKSTHPSHKKNQLYSHTRVEVR